MNVMMFAIVIHWGTVLAISLPSLVAILAAMMAAHFWWQDTRPRVYVSVHSESLYLDQCIVRNVGRKPAFDVHVRLHPHNRNDDDVDIFHWVDMLLPGDYVNIGAGQESIEYLPAIWNRIDVDLYYNRKPGHHLPNKRGSPPKTQYKESYPINQHSDDTSSWYPGILRSTGRAHIAEGAAITTVIHRTPPPIGHN